MTMRELRALEDDSIAALMDNLGLGYAETGGRPILISEIARMYGSAVNEKNVICLPGGQTGIFCAMASLLKKGDHCVSVSPCYPSLENIPAAICETTKVYLKYERGWELDLGELEDALRPNTKLN